MIDLDTDPRLTAYVLDELDREERDIFEQDMANADGDVGGLIADIKQIARMLDELYASEPEYRMRPDQRSAVLGGGGESSGIHVQADQVDEDGKVLPWVVRATIGKEDIAVVAEQLRPSFGGRVGRALLGLGIAACMMGGLFWMVRLSLPDRGRSGALGEIEVGGLLVPDGEPERALRSPGKGGAMPASPLSPDAPGYIVVNHGSPPPEVEISMYGAENSIAVVVSARVLSSGPGGRAQNFGSEFGNGSGGATNYGRMRTYPSDDGLEPKAIREQIHEGEGAVGDAYAKISENQFRELLEGKNQLSTFSIDVDTASYAIVRRYLQSGMMPPPDAVRIEEMVNYFRYAYAQPLGDHPFSASLEVADCPWAKQHRLVRIGLKGREVEAAQRPDSNLVFLIDVSGSMQSSDKLPLLKASMMELVKNLREQDSVSIVVYAGNSGLVLDATSGALQEQILSAIARLEAGGSTNGGAGIELAYSVAKENFIKGGVNRVILATDGDFNVGVTDQTALMKMVAERAKSNIYLTVLGFGTGNLNDALIEEISNRGNGNSFYIDSAREGRKVLVEEIGATLETIAKDVKIQVEFNPAKVASYRLIGYENRMLRNRDFNDDKIDAGEVGAGHSVTALYEIVPVGAAGEVDELKYKRGGGAQRNNDSPELLTLKMRYKQPEGEQSTKFDAPLVDAGKRWEQSSADFRFAASVAGFGMLLRDSEFKGGLNYALVKELATEGVDHDAKGYRKEFLELIEHARKISAPK